jgi:hypothetical protein
MTTIAQQQHVERLLLDIADIDRRAAAAAEGLDEETFLRPRPPERPGQPPGWSIGQLLEHLCVANDSYLERIRALVRPDAPRAAPGATWKPTLLGGLLIRSLAGERPLPAPRIWRVGPRVRPDVVAEFMRRERELVDLLRAGAELDWRRLRTSSPVSPLIRLDLGDCYTILVVHARRHVGQMERLRARLERDARAADAPTSDAPTSDARTTRPSSRETETSPPPAA